MGRWMTPNCFASYSEGDEKAFTELVVRYNATLIRIALYYVNSQASAEDVAQDTWIAVLRGVDRFEGRSSFKTWLFHILVNRAALDGHEGTPVNPGRSDV